MLRESILESCGSSLLLQPLHGPDGTVRWSQPTGHRCRVHRPSGLDPQARNWRSYPASRNHGFDNRLTGHPPLPCKKSPRTIAQRRLPTDGHPSHGGSLGRRRPSKDDFPRRCPGLSALAHGTSLMWLWWCPVSKLLVLAPGNQLHWPLHFRLLILIAPHWKWLFVSLAMDFRTTCTRGGLPVEQDRETLFTLRGPHEQTFFGTFSSS